MEVNGDIIVINNGIGTSVCGTRISSSCNELQRQLQQPQLGLEMLKGRTASKSTYDFIEDKRATKLNKNVSPGNLNASIGFGRNNRMVYGCHLCDVLSTSAVQLNFHLQKVHQLHCCAECKLLFPTRDSLASHELAQHRGSFPCEFCGKVLETQRKYVGHRKNHRSKNSCCYYCGFNVASKEDMSVHIEMYHPSRQFTCAFCKYTRTFPSRSDLLAHRRECALDPLQCRVCKQFYQSSEELSKHSEYHTKQQLYYHCEICGEVMIAAALLQRHLREVHDCTCPDALIETFAMTMPQIHERQRQCYRPDEARKRMTDFVLMSKRISISITRETRVMTEEKSAISKMSTTEREGAPEISELRSDKKRSRKVAQNSGRSSALGKRPRLGLIKIETCN